MVYRFENLRSKACRASSFAKSFSYLQCRKMQALTASPFIPLVSHSVKLLGKIRYGREIYRVGYPTSLMQPFNMYRHQSAYKYTHLSKVDGFMETWSNFVCFWYYALNSNTDINTHNLRVVWRTPVRPSSVCALQ